ncbi:hypothetical protein F2Q70_00014682 [Brassica cretica]|uniref:Uncharacterized protein n=1 Tax=Brassica cretica TaxID=69181 RepID=A0A8S9HWC1_BRACR|nr:hypothetical protein F2Q70_00014682 [Brassica cretica]KAF2596340.1 hypothetical protein F2Q68_00007765 [Brassica cretica]
MKSQPASQQSNKKMTDRPIQHHGPEALHDGLRTIWPVTKFTPRPQPVHPLTRLAASRHKAFQPVPRVSVFPLDRSLRLFNPYYDLTLC